MIKQSPKSPILETTADAIKAAKTIVRLARFGSISALEPATGYPLVTRTNIAASMRGNPIFLMSDLAAHTKAIKQDPRTSLLLGEPGKGDPLAHPRLTLIGQTHQIPRETAQDKAIEQGLRQRYLNRHTKAELYNQLPDFFLYELKIERALFNAGFGKAYELSGHDLFIKEEDISALVETETDIIAQMNEDHQTTLEKIAVSLCNEQAKTTGSIWRITSCDPEGIDMMQAETPARLNFKTPCTTSTALKEALFTYASQINLKASPS